jgi:hypothetical protein
VARLLADGPGYDRDREALRRTFEEWRQASRALDRLADRRPLLHEARSLVADLGALGDVGLDALSRLGTGGGASAAAWRDAALGRLEQAATPRVEVEFGVIEPLKALLEAAGR